MSILGTVGLIGIGYMVKDRIDSRPKYYGSYRANTIKQYLRNLAMDKMDDIFYGTRGTRNVSHTTNKKILIEQPTSSTWSTTIHDEPNATNKKVSYNGCFNAPYKSDTSYHKYEPKYPYKLEEAHYDDIDDAIAVIEDMQWTIRNYGYVTVADYYDLIGIDTGIFENVHWGWKDLSDDIDDYIVDDINIETGEKFYTIDLPEPMQLK